MRAFGPVAFWFWLATFASATTSDLSSAFQDILSNTEGNARYNYPTDLTRGIVPVFPPSSLSRFQLR